jgi:hypothetical protein
MRNEQKIAEAVEGLIESLGVEDPRVSLLEGRREASTLVRLVHMVLVDANCDNVTIRRALWLSSVYNNADVISDIMAILRGRPELALNAGIALERIGAPAMLDELAVIVPDTAYTAACRMGAVRAIAGIATARAAEVLRNALFLPGQEPSVLTAVIDSFMYVQLKAGAKDATSDLVRLIDSESPDVRYSVLVALGNLGARDRLREIARLRDDHSVTSAGKEVGSEADRVMRLLSGV